MNRSKLISAFLVITSLILIANWAYASTFTVTNLNDTGNGSLRWAIEQANTSSGADVINFSISGQILPQSALPDIIDNETVIDASSRWNGAWPLGQPGVTIDGSAAGDANGLTITGADECHIRGLFITNFKGDGRAGIMIQDGSQRNIIGGIRTGYRNVISGNNEGVAIRDSDNNIVSGNYIGTDVNGIASLGNSWKGVRISGGAQSNTIGGTTSGERNIISGNKEDGVAIHDSGTDINKVSGNYIGTNVNGTAALENSWNGVRISGGTQSNTVGGTTPGERNIISGNKEHGVAIHDSGTDNNKVSGNYIGTDVNGTTKLGNKLSGVAITDGAPSNIIGGTSEDARNIISGNNEHGVLIVHPGTDNNVVLGNYIGTDVTGTANLGNTWHGVAIAAGAQSNTIGGTSEGARNTISGNNEHGVSIANTGTNNNKVTGNYIGTDASGTVNLGNKESGIAIDDASSNAIGGDRTKGEGNLISGNGKDDAWGGGIRIGGSEAQNNVVSGNYIGTDITGTIDLGNRLFGVFIFAGSQSNTIGGTTPGERNIISGNGEDGVGIIESSSNNTVSGNYIGTDVTGTADLGNSRYGVTIALGANSNTIGGATSGKRNIISGNDDNSVSIINSGTSNNRILGNYIGTDASGTAKLGNSGRGVSIWDGASSNTIGGTTAGERNVISGNNLDGVEINGSDNNRISGNFIGTDVNGTAALENTWNGVRIWGGAQSNTVGGTTPDERNIISGNKENGVAIHDSGTDNNKVSGNYIGTDVNGTAALGNTWAGVRITEGAQANTIGGTTPSERNIISGNKPEGVFIASTGTSNNKVTGNYIGVDVNGTADLGNLYIGVLIGYGAQTNTIGSTTPGERNIISGNDDQGVLIVQSGTDNNVVLGNYIGTDVNGTAALGNRYNGIRICDGASLNTIGGATPGARNIISGNGESGIHIASSGTSNNIVSGNYIGTDASGTTKLGNTFIGVAITNGATSNTIGGTSEGARNIISGNNEHGMLIVDPGTDNNVVSGNYIGTDVNGTAKLGNAWNGVAIAIGAKLNTIGGTTEGERNIISGNDNHGVVIVDSGTDNNVVSGNYIGTDVNGTAKLGNTWDGVAIATGARSNTIGGTTEGERNIISGNDNHGVLIADSGTNNNVVSGNYIGTDVTGTAKLGNIWNGVEIRYGAQTNTIGGTTPGERNIISGNDDQGILIVQSGTTNNNMVLGNYIGTDVNGTVALGNRYNGVRIAEGASSNTIGGVTPGARNVISGNGENGTHIVNSDTRNNIVSGNYIGTDFTGSAPLGNKIHGILIQGGAKSNTIGGTTAGERNVISGNGTTGIGSGQGIAIDGSGTDNNVITGNYIGTDANGNAAIGNAGNGIRIYAGAQSNRVGGESPGEKNIISGNNYCGVILVDAGTNNNTIRGNYIGTDASGNNALGNLDDGINIKAGSQSNTMAANLIAFNGTAGSRGGIWINNQDTDYNKITRNSIHSNISYGIRLTDGGNDEIPAPVITTAFLNPVSNILNVSGSGAGADATVEIFKADSIASGQGMTYLGDMIANAGGYFFGSINVTGKGLSLGDVIVATTAHTNNNTSEFSNGLVVTAAAEQQCMMKEGWNMINIPGGKCFYEGTPPANQPNCVELVNINTLGFTFMAEWLNSVISPNGSLLMVIGVDGAIDSSLPNIFHTLKYISPVNGLWVKIAAGTGGAILSITGPQFDPDCPIKLLRDWNLTGYPINVAYYDTEPHPDIPGVTNWVKVDPPVAAYVFKSIAGLYSFIIGENGAYDPSLNVFFSSLHYIAPNQAFWIKMNNEADLIYSQMGPQP